ncbi:MAG TPA: glycoside hydrolase family 130 protein [Bacillales bacterium]|nr:glycoside hydrolase family 130 protein [Bacillales bacterium]
MKKDNTFPLGPFKKYPKNPILSPQGDSWEAKDVFNPTAIVHDNRVYLFYRAEDFTGEGEWNGTSRIGLAVSDDGIHFHREPRPVIDVTEEYEVPGGVEDPRVVRLGQTFYMTYSAFDGKNARLALATSKDLIHWKKHGLLFPEWKGVNDEGWSKSGAIVPEKIDGKYVMYFGDTDIYLAFSTNGLHWIPETEPFMKVSKDPNKFDSALIEPGPAPILSNEGIILLYNAARKVTEKGDPAFGKLRYSVGQVLIDRHEPNRVLKRTKSPFFVPNTQDESYGQVDNVVFVEGLVYFNETYYLYYGMADSKLGVALCNG